MQVQYLVGEDPTSHGVTKPVCHNHRACALAPLFCNNRSSYKDKPTHHNEKQPPVVGPRESLNSNEDPA